MIGSCRICGKDGIIHFCKNCGSRVCTNCFDKKLGLCLECSRKTVDEGVSKISPQGLIRLGTALIFGGFGLMTVAAILGGIFGVGEGVVIVGFFPFLFGFGSFPPILFLLTLIMSLLPLILFLYVWLTSRSELETGE